MRHSSCTLTSSSSCRWRLQVREAAGSCSVRSAEVQTDAFFVVAFVAHDRTGSGIDGAVQGDCPQSADRKPAVAADPHLAHRPDLFPSGGAGRPLPRAQATALVRAPLFPVNARTRTAQDGDGGRGPVAGGSGTSRWRRTRPPTTLRAPRRRRSFCFRRSCTLRARSSSASAGPTGAPCFQTVPSIARRPPSGPPAC